MSTSSPAVRIVLTCLAFGAIVILMMGATSSGGLWPAGQEYRFWYSGMLGPIPPAPAGAPLRTFGSPATLCSSGLLRASDNFWDATDTTGLPADQIRLVFHLAPVTTDVSSGWLGASFLDIFQLALPQGASYLPDTARITALFPEGTAPITIGPTYNGSGIFSTFESGAITTAGFDTFNFLSGQIHDATGLTFEIVVDNVPEPLTLGLFAAGAVCLISRRRSGNRCKA